MDDVNACRLLKDVKQFLGKLKAVLELIIVNRWSEGLVELAQRVYMRDLFKRD